MLITPFGKIEIYANGSSIDYVPIELEFTRPPCNDHPIAGCYRIVVDGYGLDSVSCNLECTQAVDICSSSGENYIAIEFRKEYVILTIGAECEHSAFESICAGNGIRLDLLQPVEKVEFGIAWATDRTGADDVRTWYAADPTLK